jgi:transposase
MWTSRTRKQYARDQLTYASNLTAEEWAILEPLLPVPAATGRPWQWPLKLIVEAIFYVLRTGCQWRYLPSDFPPWPTVYYWFRRPSADGTWKRVNHTLVMAARQCGGRDASPTAAIIDSQSMKATEAAGPRGYDAGKKIKGCKRHILTDTEGHLLSAVVHEACIQDRDGAVLLFSQLFGLFPFISRIFADGGYAGEKLKQALRSFGNWCIEIVKRSDQAKGFVLLPRRWVVERTFAWFGRNRRLSRQFEASPETAVAYLYAASVMLLARRLARSS